VVGKKLDLRDLGDLTIRMLSPDPTKRPSIDLILDHLAFSNIKSLSSGDVFGGFERGEVAVEIPDALSGGMRRQLLKEDVSEAANVLTIAMKDDPRYKYAYQNIISDEALYIKTLHRVFELLFQAFLKKHVQLWGRYDRDNRCQAVAVWSNPDQKKRLCLGKILLFMMMRSIEFIPKVGLATVKRMRKLAKTIDKGFIPVGTDTAWWQLVYLGVDPNYQNQKIGYNLMEPVLEWADREKKGCQVATYSETSLGFFMKCGFETVKVLHDPVDLPKGLGSMWIMFRKPK